MKDYIAQAAKIGYKRIFTSMLEVAGNSSATIGRLNLTARNSPTSKVAGCKGFGLVQGLAPCA